MIESKNIYLKYGNLEVLKDINFKIDKGEFISIVGDSGAGKTSLLQLLGTLEVPNSGKIIINNVNINDIPDNKLSKFRNENIGFVFQFHNLLPEFSALENVMLPSLISNKSKIESRRKSIEILSDLNMINRINHKPNQLSGGEKQRVALARALINKPDILLADEPSGNLDSKNARILHELLLKLNKESNQTIVVVTHNEELASISDRRLEIIDGIIK
tara:strand:+ start:8378 stop:9028 length:651 start_codon:yes stop_codon:yes gene_type:complete